MAWLDDSLILLRILIGDDDSPYDYCDDRLSNMIIGSAKMVLFELSFDNNYVVDMNTLTITPDPSDDPYFIPLICLFAAVKIANSEFKKIATASVTITDGPATIDMTGQATSYKARRDALQKDWENSKKQYGFGINPGAGFVQSTLQSIYSRSYVNGYFNSNSYYNSNYNYEFHY